jgi:hypothetical protein
MKTQWKAIPRHGEIGSKRMLNGCWLVDPDGKRIATIMDFAIAQQIAAAMNLTTTKQRSDWCAEASGYKSRSAQTANKSLA